MPIPVNFFFLIWSSSVARPLAGLGAIGAGGPRLLAVQHPVIAHVLGPALQGGEVAAIVAALAKGKLVSRPCSQKETRLCCE